MTSKRFPRSPEITPSPFEDGKNPFADDVTTPIPFSENPLQGPTIDEVQPYRPADYEQTLPDRSQRILLYGLAGAGFVFISMIILASVFNIAPWWSTKLVYAWPADLLGLALSISAWVMGHSDLRAIRAGAMDDSGLRSTRIGYWCGCIATIIGLFPFLGVVIAIVLSIFS